MRNYKRRKKIILVIFIAILTYICLNFQSKFIIKDNVLLEYKRGILADIMPKKEVEIPYGVTEIGEKAFKNCSELKKVVIPDSVVKINSCAFLDCKNLIEVKLPENVTEISFACFSGCKHLRTVVLNGKLDNIDMFAFANCKDLEYIDFPNSIRKIDEFSFCYTSLKKVELPEGLEYIGGEVFMGDENLEEVKFPKSLEIIDAKGYLFDECPNLKKIILPKGFDLDLVYDDTVSIEYYE